MDIRVVDFKGDWENVSIDMNDVVDIYLMILSGDEVLRIHRGNGNEEVIDPMELDRIESIYQGGYYIYDAKNPGNVYDITSQEEWLNRRGSGEYLFTRYEMMKNAEG